ncbi:Ctr copper transporter family domain-containing protein [Trichoderma compactum]
MDMSMPGSSAGTMPAMPMATPTDGSMPMDSSRLNGNDFFTATNTALFSSSWTPNTTGQYAGTCIFLIAFATIFRAILAIRVNFHQVVDAIERRRRHGRIPLHLVDYRTTIRPWRADEAVKLAFMDLILAGVGYLLMIVLMTMNVGYFLSVLAGVFLGSVIFNRFLAPSLVH